MENIDLVERDKIITFLKSCDDMINGKFILADIKIMKILNMIAESDALSKYIQECMIDFNFEREYSRAEVKNRFNNSSFIVPQDNKQLVALVFCLLSEFDKKHIDFYAFINNNFQTLNQGGEYESFTKTLLVPFRNVIAYNFGLLDEKEFLKAQREESLEEIKLHVENIDEAADLPEEKNEIKEVWNNISNLIDSLVSTVSNERKVKGELKENILYILKSVKYCSKYGDMRLISSLLLSVEMLLKKVSSTKILITEIKNEIVRYYDLIIDEE